MSKLKASFSLIIMLLVVGLFSTAAFAAATLAGPEGLTVKQNTDNTITLKWGAVAGPKNHTYTNVTYDLTVTEYGAAQADSATALTFGTGVTPTYTTVALDAGKKYTLALTFNAKDYNGAPVTGTTTIDYSMVDYNSTLTTGDDNDNNLNNANHTGANVTDNSGSLAGYNGVNKARDDHKKVHGSYQNNTNSCASCHQTHTGNSDMLLFKNGTYDTCSACHDGTLGFYNVFKDSNAGTFGGSHAGNMSVHLADGAVAIAAAPGGNPAGNGSWAGEFTCASCHSPHGSDSIRLLSSNPGGVASKTGDVYADLASLPDPNAVGAPTYAWVKSVVADTTKYPGLSVGDKVIQLYKLDGAAGSKTYKAYYDLATKETISQGNWFLKADGKSLIRAGVDFLYYTNNTINVFGYVPAGGNAANGYDVAVHSSFTVPLIVTGTLIDAAAPNGVAYTKVDNRAYFDSAYINYKANSGKSMSAWCTACHADYLSDTHSNESGVYTQTYRHQTNSDKLTCVRCHFAHGTEAAAMKDSLDRGIPELTAPGGLYQGDVAGATSYLLDPNPSSALKRYTGMAVCFGCHDASIAGDAATWSNTDALKQPGAN